VTRAISGGTVNGNVLNNTVMSICVQNWKRKRRGCPKFQN